MIRKALALLLAYCFLATSMWSLTAPGGEWPRQKPLYQAGMPGLAWMLAHSLMGKNASLLNEAGAPLNSLHSATSPVFTNFTAANAPSPYDDGPNVPANCTVHSATPKSDRDDGDEHDGEDGQNGHRHYSYDDGPNPPPAGIVASGFKIFGPQTYVRTTGSPNQFDSSVTVPAWLTQPFYLHVENGDSDKKHRNSSATILINGVTVLGPSAFNENVGSIDCAVSLPAQSTLHVTLASKPGSFLIISLLGQNTDHTAPQLAITAPANGASVNTATPHLAVSYNDVRGASEPAASGVNTETLQILLDGVDRTSLFTKRPTDATADVPSSLALSAGPHTLTATIKDNAANTAQAVSQFQVDLTPITIQIVAPAAGAFLNGTATQSRITYSDNLPINPTTLKVLINGVDKSALFTATTNQATALLNPATDLRQGANQIVATIRDQAGNQGTASVAFNVDAVPPVITILHPLPASRHGSASVEYSVQFTDDQAVDLTSLQIAMDGAPLAVTPTANLATGTTTLADGNHTLTAQIKDKAGNTASTSSTFSVDTTAPDIHIIQPAAGAILNVASTPVEVHYGDQNIDTTSLHIALDGVDKTAGFTVSATSATGTFAGPLSEGPHTITAQIADLTGNIGNASTTLLIDTIKPVLTIASPVGPVNTATPTARANYSDAGSGINPASVHVFVDGSDVTAGFSIGSDSAVGVLSSGGALSEGTHQLRVTVADRAGNVADVSASFVVDITPPIATFVNPANNSFINSTQPTLKLDYSDAGSGVNTSTAHIFLQQGTAAETEITPQFTFGPAEATATISAANALVAGTYHLRALVTDRAGNTTTALSTFQVDTTAPVYTIQTPAASSFINTATPTFLVTYHDDSSGVDPSKFAIRVDGTDRTNSMTVGDLLATGTLLPADALADGTHQVEVTVIDRAGNTANIVPQSFLVDTTAPAISVTTAAVNGFTNNNHPPITVSYSDAGSGIDTTKFLLLIDGVDHTAEFTVTATGATGSPAVALSDGAHVVTATISDLAGNPSAPATTAFSVNTVAPLITITQPVDGAFTNAASVVVTGTVVSALAVTVKVEGVPASVQSGVFTSQPVVLGAGPSQTIHVAATDAQGTSSTAAVTVSIDRTPPTIIGSITPSPTAAGWNNSAVTVNFVCSDAGSGVATCSGPVTFTAQGANQVATGTATDRVGNTAQASVTVNIDLTAPLITASATPAPNAAGWNNTDVLVSYLCSDSLSGIAVCPLPATISTEGANVEVTGQTVDKAGNTAGVTTSLKIDKTPPLVIAAAAPPPNGAGFNNSNVNVTFTCSDALSGVAICPQPQTVGTEGLNQNISGQATDVAGNVSTGSISLSIDKTPPTIVQLVAPDHISRLHSGLITVTANDNFSVAQVVISVNGTSLGTFTAAPYQATLQVPLGSNPGDTLTITAQATDAAGNTQTATRGVRIAADGVVIGQVLSDVTSFPIQGATVQMIGTTSQIDQTDSRGRYSLPASDSHLFVVVSNGSPATTAVEREVFVQEGVGTVPVDARLTPLAAPVAMGSGNLTLTAGNIQVTAPAGAALPATTFQLTPISGQGLPGLLPLGWSPLAALDLRASSAAANLSATFTHLPNTLAHLVFYNPALHAWTMIAPGLQPVSGNVTATLPAPGAYALVVPDVVNPPIAIPAPGDPLLGVAVQLLAPDATSTGSLNPAIVPPSGGTAIATLGIQSQAYVPSGTVIQANVSERFSLKSGAAVSEESRSEDIILYSALAPANSAMGALFPVTPARTFGNTELLTGKVHLDILAGREGVRGQPGGSDPLTLSDGISTLSVPGGALSDDTAISVQSSALEDFIPVSSTLGALQEILVD
ncbi:MAG TPA: Ig-like domain-containing protein, partial [Candidatus Angelobacter sp.]|nr:Ig-like domain-containing protein [Candidatus Angelobacter sp.]